MKLKDDLRCQKQHSDDQSALMESRIRAHESEKLKLVAEIENRKRELDHMEGEARARIDEMTKLLTRYSIVLYPMMGCDNSSSVTRKGISNMSDIPSTPNCITTTPITLISFL